jgi:hypothetical protein
MLAVYPQLCGRVLAEYILLYIFPILIQPLLHLKKVRRCEAQVTHFVLLPFLCICRSSSWTSVQVKLFKSCQFS